MRNVMLCLLSVATHLAYGQPQSVSPVPYASPGSVYTQNFDGLPASGSIAFSGKGPFNLAAPPVNGAALNGWQVFMTGGSNPNAAFAAGTGSATGNGIYSLGAAGLADRALGSLASSTGVYAMGLVLTNTTGITLNSCTITFTTEQWRRGGSGNRNTWACRYKTGLFSHIDQTGLINEPSLDMVSVTTAGGPGSLNGNLPANQLAVSFTISGITWKTDEQLLLRWDDADEPGSDDACGLDNFSFSANQTSSVPSVTSLAATMVTANSAVLNGSVNDNYSSTAVRFEYDTVNNFTYPVAVPAAPDSIHAGTGNTAVSAAITGLGNGITYYFRAKADNANGYTTGSRVSFTTAIRLPVVLTKMPDSIGLSSVILGGMISAAGGAPVIEKGIVWSLINPPTLADNTIRIENGTDDFAQAITGLPQGTAIYARAYATNAAGTAYGNTQSFTTATTIVSLLNTSTFLTNADSVNFTVKTAQSISGLSVSNFALVTSGLTNAFIKGITGSGSLYTISVNTGTGDGILNLRFQNDTGLSEPVSNKPFLSAGFYKIDKTPPLIFSVNIPDRSMKIGDTVPVTITVAPDTGKYMIKTGSINGKKLSVLSKKNDSTYHSFFIIANGDIDVAATADIPVTLILTDDAGNNSASYQSPIVQNSDPIDAHRPIISALTIPQEGLYKAADTLRFIFRFSEKIILTATAGSAGFSLTIGSRSRYVQYASGSGSDSLLFYYIIQSGDSDKNGIKISSPLTFINTMIKDIAGNNALLSFSPPSTRNILVDAVPPTISGVSVPPPAIYKTGNLLDFVLNYTKKVFVNTGNQFPLLTINIGGIVKNAVYQNGSGSNALLFRYRIEEDDMDKDGIKLISPLVLNDATIKDEPGNTASATFTHIGALRHLLINPVSISVSHVLVPAKGIYKTGDTLVFITEFTEPATVNISSGIPSLKFTVGSTSRHAFYQTGSGSTKLVFIYVIQPGDEDSTGIKMNTNISLHNSAIQDARGNIAPVTLQAIGNTTGILIDAVNPSVKNVITPAKKMYKENDTLLFTVNFTEKIRVGNQDPVFIKMIIGSTVKKINYVNGSGTAAIILRYVIQQGDLDKKGIRLDSLINGYITDLAGNPVMPALKNTGAVSGIKIDAVAPVFLSAVSVRLLCENASDVSIGELMTVKDEETNEQVSWQLYAGIHGRITKTIAVMNANGGNLTPVFQYQPDPGYAGTDSLIAEVTDGIHYARKIIVIEIQPGIKNNSIGPPQIVCTNHTPFPIMGSMPSGGDGIYAINWESSVTGDATGFTKASGDNHLTQYAPTALRSTTWFRRKVVSGACIHISAASRVTALTGGLWTGNFDHDWNNRNNWCMETIPANTGNVIINGNTLYEPEIKDSARCDQLTLLNNATIKITGVLEIKGSIIHNSNRIDAAKGTLLFSGNMQQTLPAGLLANGVLQNLVINNPSGVSVEGPVIVSGNILLNSGSLITHDMLTLQHTASIGSCATGTSIKGNITINHFIPGGKRAFRLLGHPFSNSIGLDMIRNNIDITGTGASANGFINTVTNEPSAFQYDPLKANDSSGIDAGWTAFTHTNGQSENAWKEFNAIRIFVRGAPGQGLDGIPAGDGSIGTYLPKPVLLSMSGQVHTGNHEIGLSKDSYPCYAVVANPYASAIDMSRVTRSTGISDYFWIWNPQQAIMGGYSSLPFKSSYILPPFGAFIVRVNNNSNPSLLFTENCKTGDTGSTGIPLSVMDDPYFIELRLETDSIFWDRLLILATDSARTGFDKTDAEKFQNNEVNFYSISRDKKNLSIDARPLHNESTVPLGLETVKPGQFSIRVAAANLAPSNRLLLHDKYLDKWMRLEKDSSYPFLTTTDTATTGKNRFEIKTPRKINTDTVNTFIISLKAAPVPAIDKLIVNYRSPEKANTMIRLLDLNGVPVKTLSLGVQKEGQLVIPVADIVKGMYLLEVKCGDRFATQKIIKE